MANIFTPTAPANGPWFIDREDCIGDSLSYINANTNWLGVQLQNTTQFTDTRINNLSSSFVGLLSSNGYQKLPGGLILQWGQSPAFTTELAQTLTFPIPFPTTCLQVIAGTRFSTNDASVNAFIQTVSWNNSQVILRAQSDLAQPTVAKPIFGHYIAIGF